ncbi:PrsW family intramembrane metalloprotease [Candidatus Micrarchaeota archaeon]|nr:PrsW family intramembrane metalloprotease [Candidatus Micrarchaeota archaeon]
MIKKLFAIFLFFVVCTHALTIRIDDIKQIRADIRVTESQFQEKDGEIIVEASVTNTGETSKLLYLAEEMNEIVVVVKPIGVIGPNTKADATIKIQTQYMKETYRERRFVLFLEKDLDEKYPGRYFIVNEDWSKYESSITEMVVKSNILTIPVIALIIVIFIYLISTAISSGPFHAEHLFFPKTTTIYEDIANILINPITWMVEIVIILVMGLVINFYYGGGTDILWPHIFLMSIVGALLFPIIYLAMGWFLGRKKRINMPLKFFWGLFLYGAVAAYMAFVINTLLVGFVRGFAITDVAYLILTAAVLAPIIEEVVKLLGLFITSLHIEFNDSITGLLFGFAIGVGFSFIENWFYFSSRTDPLTLGFYPWIQLIIYRSVFNSLAHGVVTGIGGAIIGHVKSLTSDPKIIVVSWLVAVLLSIPLHAMFNVSAILDGSVSREYIFGLPSLFNPLIVIFLLMIFVITYVVTFNEKINKRKVGDC